MDQLNTILASLVPGFADASGVDTPSEAPEISNTEVQDNHQDSEYNLVYSDEDDILYFDISREQIEYTIEMAREQYQIMLDEAASVNNILFEDDATPYLSPISSLNVKLFLKYHREIGNRNANL